MIRTALCELFEIDHPIVQAGMGVGATNATLAAAVANAGALGSLSASQRSPAELELEVNRFRDLSNGSLAVNHVVPTLNEEAFRLTLAARPKVISMALGDPGELVKRAHDAGSLVMHQVNTVRQAVEAAERGVDVLVAQGAEAGGFGGFVATMILVPQVVDAVSPVPVLAAGSIAGGRELAAALILGAVGPTSERGFSLRESHRSAMNGSRRSSLLTPRRPTRSISWRSSFHRYPVPTRLRHGRWRASS